MLCSSGKILLGEQVRGFTLLEMLVCLFVISVLLGLGAYGFNYLSRRDLLIYEVNNFQASLLISQRHAARDKVPTGLRFYVESGGICTHYDLIQQPELITGGQWVSPDTPGAVPVPWRKDLWVRGGVSYPFNFQPTWRAFWNSELISFAGNSLIGPGDYLLLHNHLYHITGLQQATFRWEGVVYTVVYTMTTMPPPANLPPTCDYVFFRQPRRLPGIDEVRLSEGVKIKLPSQPATQLLLFHPGGYTLDGRSWNILLSDGGREIQVRVGSTGSIFGE